MARQFPSISPELAAFIGRQPIFFTGTAAPGSRVNISPREGAALRVLGPDAACYLDQTGSGAETAAHLATDGRITIMLCAFQGPPMILRLYGRGRSLLRGTADYAALLAAHYDNTEPPGARQIVRIAVDLVQTSCGYGVPLFEHTGERDTLRSWAERKGEEGLAAYRAEKNARSIDGIPTEWA
jgi:hypothetical protein